MRPPLVSRIREHMRDYIAHLPDYTCRITLERFRRLKPRAPFDLGDRLRLEVAYTGGQELYSWPGDARFERGIEDLLPGHGMVSNGSYALHIRNLFLRDVAEFAAPHDEKCEGLPCVRLDFHIPALRSGYALSAGSGSAPAPLDRLRVVRPCLSRHRPPGSPRRQRAALRTHRRHTRNHCSTSAPASATWNSSCPPMSELMLRDRDGSEMLNRSRFDHYRRYAGSSTVSYGPAGDTPPPAVPTPAPRPSPQAGKQLTASLDTAIPEDAAIGDAFTATTAAGEQLTGRITNLRRAGKSWLADLTLSNLVRRSVTLPLKAATKLTWKID